MKRLLALILMFAMILSLTLCTSASAELLEGLYLNSTYVELSEGDSATIKAVGISGEEISFNSYDDTVALVDSDGVITAVAEGETIIEASDGRNSAQCTINVKPHIEEGIRLNERYVIGKSGDSFQLSVELSDDLNPADIVWSSSNSNRVSVEQNGLVTVLATQMSETVYITATLGAYSDTCCVYIASVDDSRMTLGTNKHFTYNANNKNSLFQYMYYVDGEYHYYDEISGSGLNSIHKSSESLPNGTVGASQWRSQTNDIDTVVAYMAPYAGTVSLYLRNGFSDASSSVSSFKIMHNSERIYPVGDDEYLSLTEVPLDTYNAGKRYVPPLLSSSTQEYNTGNWNTAWPDGISVDVQKGDYIYFHMNDSSTGNGLVMYNNGFEIAYDEYFIDDVSSVSFIQNSITGEIGESIDTQVVYSGNNIEYFSDDESVARVDESGRITVLSEGQCRIFAVVDDRVADFCSLEGLPVTKILLNNNIVNMAIGKTAELKADYYPAITTGIFEWSSSSPDIVSVDNKGLLTALSGGNAVITVSDGKKSAECMVFVDETSEKISLNKNACFLGLNESFALIADKADEYNGEDIVWSSSNPNSITVSSKGIVTGKAIGVAQIRAQLSSDSGIYSECTVVCGNLNQNQMFSKTIDDNSADSVWQYAYSQRGGMSFEKFSDFSGTRWSAPEADCFIQAAEISYGKKTDAARIFRAPISGHVEISVNNNNSFTNADPTTLASARLDVVAKGKVIKSFLFTSKEKTNGSYYATTRYNAGEEGEVSDSAYLTGIDFQEEFGTIELDVYKGECIYFICRGISGSGWISTYNNGFQVQYTSTDSVAGIQVTQNDMFLKCGDITTQFNAQIIGNEVTNDNIFYFSGDENIIEINGSGAIRAKSPGSARVYAVNSTETVMSYADVEVLQSDMTVDNFVYTTTGDDISIKTSVSNASTEKKVTMISVMRNSLGIPIEVCSSEDISIAENETKDILLNLTKANDCDYVDTYILKYADSIGTVVYSEHVSYKTDLQ